MRAFAEAGLTEKVAEVEKDMMNLQRLAVRMNIIFDRNPAAA